MNTASALDALRNTFQGKPVMITDQKEKGDERTLAAQGVCQGIIHTEGSHIAVHLQGGARFEILYVLNLETLDQGTVTGYIASGGGRNRKIEISS